MNRFVLKNIFIKVYLHHYSINIFYNNKRSKLYIGDRAVVLNVSFSERREYYLEKATMSMEKHSIFLRI
jgi:hypothetical protein